MKKIKAFLSFSRPHTIIGTTLSVTGLYLIAWAHAGAGQMHWQILLLTLLSCLGANIYIVGLNQLTDVEIDRINKPNLPLASGVYSLRTGKIIIALCLTVSLFIALREGGFLLLTVVLSVLIGTAYSLPPGSGRQYLLIFTFQFIAERNHTHSPPGVGVDPVYFRAQFGNRLV